MLMIPVGLASFMFWTSLKICRSHFEVLMHLSLLVCLFLPWSLIFTLTPVDCLLSCSVYLGDLEPGKLSPNTRACVIPRDIVFVFFILTNMDCFSWVACYWRLISNSRRVILVNSEPGCVSHSALLEPSLLREPGDLAATQKSLPASCVCTFFFFFLLLILFLN